QLNQFQFLHDLLKLGQQAEAQEQLTNLQVPDGLRPEVIEAYKRLADIAANSPPGMLGEQEQQFEHVLDSDGTQAFRLQILNSALAALQNLAPDAATAAKQAI